jgi:hypothetical protein
MLLHRKEEGDHKLNTSIIIIRFVILSQILEQSL